jgi:signal recognition particle receptor subunit beta
MSSKPCEVLVLGGAEAGKSALLRRLKHLVESEPGGASSSAEEFAESVTTPTIGVELTELTLKGRRVLFREVGSAMSSRWSSYFEGSAGIVFVVDASETQSLGTSMTLLYEVLCSKPRTTPLAVCLNKNDLCDPETCVSVCNILRLEELAQTNTAHTLRGRLSCIDGSAAAAVVNWVERAVLSTSR